VKGQRPVSMTVLRAFPELPPGDAGPERRLMATIPSRFACYGAQPAAGAAKLGPWPDAGTLIMGADPHPGEDHTGGGVTLRRLVGGIPEMVQVRELTRA
jgi:hypothetical protein